MSYTEQIEELVEEIRHQEILLALRKIERAVKPQAEGGGDETN